MSFPQLIALYSSQYLKSVQESMLKLGIRLTPREEEEIELAYEEGYKRGFKEGSEARFEQ